MNSCQREWVKLVEKACTGIP